MAILTNPQSHGLLLRAIVEHVGDAAVDRPTLLRRFCLDADDEPALISETLEVGAVLGVLDPARKVSVKRAGDREDAATTIRFWLMNDDVVGDDLFADRAPGASDLLRGMCWLLSQDPADGPITTKNFEERQRGLPKQAITNVEQYRAVTRWSCWSGLASLVARQNYRMVPSLTTVVRGCLPSTGTSIPIADLESKVAEAVPVAPRGWIRSRYDEVVGRSDESMISPVVSYALETLRDDGTIQLRVAEDAAIGGQEQRLLAASRKPVTDVEVLA